MKLVHLALPCLLFCAFKRPSNTIDGLHTDSDVISFYNNMYAKKHKALKLLPYYNGTTKIADSLGAKNWLKMDFNKDGKTDLLIFRQDGITDIEFILSQGNEFKIIKPEYAQKFQFIYPIIKLINNRKSLLMYSNNQVNYDSEQKKYIYSKLECDTLTYKCDKVVNFSSHPYRHSIKQIKILNNGACEGDCPKTSVTVNFLDNSSTANKQADDGTQYSGLVSKQGIEEMKCLLRYADIPNFQSDYRVRSTDQTTTTVIITYDDDKQKLIKDYGSIGNFTLAEIYKITYSIHWMKNK